MKTLVLFLTVLFFIASPLITQAQLDTLKDSSSTNTVPKYFPPPPGTIESVALTINGYVIHDYLYWLYFASGLDDYNDILKVAFIGNKWHADDGVMKVKKYQGRIIWVYNPNNYKDKYKKRKYSSEATF